MMAFTLRTQTSLSSKLTSRFISTSSEHAAACVSADAQMRSFMSTQAVSMPEEETHMLLLIGRPGGGKGTIAKKILKDFPKAYHLSTGDLLRQHVRDCTKLGGEAKSYMERGELVPDSLMVSLVMEDATPHLEEGRSLLLDGFPRNQKQAEALEDVAQIDAVVNLDIPIETIVERIADRWIHPASGRVYSYSYNPPKEHGKDDVTGEPLIQREDDKPEVVRGRLAAYEEVTQPLVQFYSERGLLKTFSGTQSDVIYPQVRSWLEERDF